MSKWDKKRSGQVHENRPQRDEGDESCSDEDNEIREPVSIDIRICLWEFGQNDPKRLVLIRVKVTLQVLTIVTGFHISYTETVVPKCADLV